MSVFLLIFRFMKKPMTKKNNFSKMKAMKNAKYILLVAMKKMLTKLMKLKSSKN